VGNSLPPHSHTHTFANKSMHLLIHTHVHAHAHKHTRTQAGVREADPSLAALETGLETRATFAPIFTGPGHGHGFGILRDPEPDLDLLDDGDLIVEDASEAEDDRGEACTTIALHSSHLDAHGTCQGLVMHAASARLKVPGIIKRSHYLFIWGWRKPPGRQ
jgi:hypothetical protein